MVTESSITNSLHYNSRRPDPTKCRRLLHEWVPENIAVEKKGRACRLCRNAANRAWAHKSGVRQNRLPGVTPTDHTRAMFEDYEDMRDGGESFDGCMRRLGISANGFMLARKRWPDWAPRLHTEGAHW